MQGKSSFLYVGLIVHHVVPTNQIRECTWFIFLLKLWWCKYIFLLSSKCSILVSMVWLKCTSRKHHGLSQNIYLHLLETVRLSEIYVLAAYRNKLFIRTMILYFFYFFISDPVFVILYKELYFRHIYAKLQVCLIVPIKLISFKTSEKYTASLKILLASQFISFKLMFPCFSFLWFEKFDVNVYRREKFVAVTESFQAVYSWTFPWSLDI